MHVFFFLKYQDLLVNAMIIVDFLLLIFCLKSNNNTILGIGTLNLYLDLYFIPTIIFMFKHIK